MWAQRGGVCVDAKAYLSQARQAERGIAALAERRRRCGELAGYRGGDGPELDALQRELDGRIEDYAALVREIEGKIDRVENPLYREVLRYRYLNGWSWQVIAGRMCFSRDWLMKLHARALGEVEGTGNRQRGTGDGAERQ